MRAAAAAAAGAAASAAAKTEAQQERHAIALFILFGRPRFTLIVSLVETIVASRGLTSKQEFRRSKATSWWLLFARCIELEHSSVDSSTGKRTLAGQTSYRIESQPHLRVDLRVQEREKQMVPNIRKLLFAFAALACVAIPGCGYSAHKAANATAAPNPPGLETLYVAQDGSADFTSIQAAINAAPETGALIVVAPGTYREVLTVNKPRLR
ncbi:MAG: hypothetical protein WBF42_17065, partial [Terracidiphilus sp.]